MDSSMEVSDRPLINIFVRDKLPMALPLLPRGRLLSEPPRSVLELQPPPGNQAPLEETQDQLLGSTADPHQRKSIMINRLSELLMQP